MSGYQRRDGLESFGYCASRHQYCIARGAIKAVLPNRVSVIGLLKLVKFLFSSVLLYVQRNHEAY